MAVALELLLLEKPELLGERTVPVAAAAADTPVAAAAADTPVAAADTPVAAVLAAERSVGVLEQPAPVLPA